MSELLEPRYDHQKTEKGIYELWEKSGYFNPDNLARAKKSKPFTIIMPPPNANGSLHLGHAVFITIQDILIRFWRMCGRKALWLPGADHAGFETQVVFDKKLEKEGRNRFEIPREQLFREIWDFTQQNKKIMEGQLRELGASCDWSREKFTLDPSVIKVVYETFKKLYDDGLAYRDNRIVNWCTKHQTTLSELETKYVEREDPLYYIKYGPVELATVRPETKFGDTAIAVNPKDKRYAKLVGREVDIQTLLGPAKIKVIADEAVDKDFGTGAVKVTPAHDPNDFEIWKRHRDEIPGPKVVIDQYGRIDLGAFSGNEKSKRYHGLKIAEARKVMEEDMEKEGLMVKVDRAYKHSVATCYKCGTILEPRILPQWFVKMKPLADKAIKAAETKKVVFHPESSKKVYLHWLKNIRDWNISRQIVWGIRIPAWYCLSCSEPRIDPKVKAKWFFVRHGEIDNIKHLSVGQTDIPLNEIGRKQAESAAGILGTEKIDVIISSDLSRTRETAEIISKATGAKIIFEKDLRERHFGEGQGITKEERDRLYGQFVYSYTGKIPGGESFAEVEERTLKAIERYAESHRDKNIVFVSHGGPIRLALKHFRKEDSSSLDKTPRRDAMLAGEPALGEVNQVDILDACAKCKGSFYAQDKDVFDTWFSSGQWPFATLMTTDKKMGFHEEVVPQVLKGKSKTYRLRDHGFKIGDKVLFENSATETIFGYGIITEVEQTTIDRIDYKDKTHYKTYKNLEELMEAFRHKNPEKTVTPKSTAYLYAYEFHPSKNQEMDFRTFYPTDVMETGYDILFFWVARMIMLGLYRTGKVPFKDVYLHGLVLDKDKKKMSKSKGNVIDPLGVAEIYGSDALRIALVAGNTAGNDIVISEDKIRGYRNFATKIWNIARFVQMHKPAESGRPELAAADKKNLAEVKKTKTKVAKHIERFEFHLAAETAYHYVWHNFADKIIEDYKPRLNGEVPADKAAAYATLENILIECLKMLHPFMPFITEEIYQKFLPVEALPARHSLGEVGAKEGNPERLLMTEEWISG